MPETAAGAGGVFGQLAADGFQGDGRKEHVGVADDDHVFVQGGDPRGDLAAPPTLGHDPDPDAGGLGGRDGAVAQPPSTTSTRSAGADWAFSDFSVAARARASFRVGMTTASDSRLAASGFAIGVALPPVDADLVVCLQRLLGAGRATITAPVRAPALPRRR